MKKSLVVMLAVAALSCGLAASAAPRVLSSAALDQVTAGQAGGIFTWFFGSEETTQALVDATDLAVSAGAANSAADAGAESFDGAIADQEAIALNGVGNVGVDLKVDVPVQDSFNVNVADEDNAVAVMGTDNHTVVDNTYVNGNITGSGVVAREATVTNSFNTSITEIDVDVQIDDSFNVTNNCMDISGQNGLTAIINANSVGDQMVGACLNVTNAAASVPSVQAGTGGVVPIVSGNALALTVMRQLVINSSIVADATFQIE